MAEEIADLHLNQRNIDVDKLLLDDSNPRLAEFGADKAESQQQILATLWKTMAVDEVAMSIAASGFWQYEPLFAVKEDGRYKVIEGNRRLAAVKLLRDEQLRDKVGASDLPKLSKSRLKSLDEIPVIEVPNRESLWRYLGFKHVNGPAKWRSYAKALYIAQVKKRTGTPLNEIAEQIGDRHRTVQRLYRALMVIEQAEKAGVYSREYVNGRLAFSHLMTALDYDEYARFLSIRDKAEETTNPVPRSKLKELGELCTWLWGDNRDDTVRVIESQNPDLRNLARVIDNKDALRELRKGKSLSYAFEISKGDEIIFAEALQDAKLALTKAAGRVSSGYEGDKATFELARIVTEMANDLMSLMEKRAGPRTKRRRTAIA